jgi:hypothetical protein
VAAPGETWQIIGCKEDGEERETREAKADGKVDEEDGEEDDEIHRPPAIGMRWPERTPHCRRRWSEEQPRGAMSESFPASYGDFFTPVDR